MFVHPPMVWCCCTVKGREPKAGEVHGSALLSLRAPRTPRQACHQLLTVLPRLLPQPGLALRSTFHEQSLQVLAWLQPDSHTTGKEVRSVEMASASTCQTRKDRASGLASDRHKDGTGLTDRKPPKSISDITSYCQ